MAISIQYNLLVDREKDANEFERVVKLLVPRSKAAPLVHWNNGDLQLRGRFKFHLLHPWALYCILLGTHLILCNYHVVAIDAWCSKYAETNTK